MARRAAHRGLPRRHAPHERRGGRAAGRHRGLAAARGHRTWTAASTSSSSATTAATRCATASSRSSGCPASASTVVDNASPDRSLEVVADLPVQAIDSGRNGGFAFGCNLGMAAGNAPLVLFLNPDARIDAEGLERLAAVLEAEPDVAIVGPRLLEDGDRLVPSMRRFQRTGSTWAQALFLHRVLRRAAWANEIVRDPAALRRRRPPRVALGRLHARTPRRARADRRLRRGLLPLLRGHGPVRAAAGRGPRDPLRAGRRGSPRGRALGAAGQPLRGPRSQPHALRAPCIRGRCRPCCSAPVWR